MATATISIQVDEEVAKAFATASTEEQRKIELLLRLRLQDLTLGPHKPLKVVMDEIGEQVIMTNQDGSKSLKSQLKISNGTGPSGFQVKKNW